MNGSEQGCQYVRHLVDSIVKRKIHKVDKCGRSCKDSAGCLSTIKQKRTDQSEKQLENNVKGGKWTEKVFHKFLINLNMQSIVISFALSVLLAHFGTICKSNIRLRQQESLPPIPFFPLSSRNYLIDYYTGDDAKPEKLLHYSEIVIVMYYAPWSRKCIQTRSVFESVARSFSKFSDVSFAAVNCFFHRGECRQSYTSHTYPIIIAYIGKQNLMYTGVLAADYIYRWISHLRKPVRRLVTSFDVINFLAEFDNTVTAFFDMEVAFASSYGFRQYIKAALMVLQRHDFLDKIGFAVVTNSSMAMTFSSSPKTWIQFTSWNYTISYTESSMTANKISQWHSEMNGVVKSDELLSILQTKATVIIFMDRQILYPYNWAVSIVEQTIMEYYACGSNLTDKLRSRSSRFSALTKERSYMIAASTVKCPKIIAYAKEVLKCCLAEKTSLISHCFQCRFVESFKNSRSCSRPPLFAFKNRTLLFHNFFCLNIVSALKEEKLLNTCCALFFSKNYEWNSSQSTFEQCAKYRLARNLYRRISDSSPSIRDAFDETSIAGLSCDKNNSLRFIGVDARYDDSILKRLNIHYTGKPVALIVDPRTERVFHMQSEFSGQTFRNFLLAYHVESLKPHLFSQNEPNSTESVNSDLSFLSSISGKSFAALDRRHEDTVIFFSGGSWHGPSASIIHIFHTVAHYFHPFVKLIRIDVSLNELSWQFQMDTLPAVLFFPAGRQSSSRFPATLPLTVPNLISFIVTKCQKELRWQLALSSCSAVCLKRNYERLLKISGLIRNDITSLRLHAFSNYHYSVLFQRLVLRRSKQLRYTRWLLKTISTPKVF
ncbi:unnamed protein product [Thelazia callipaeda]|uniref:Thioredoxin domain-containing protein n=1 Tax=Thelazia callipaeda TaxID=103827 RepID=A0A0N5CUP4_THECL|nr:unnamed protein product [Thelazia callipaeda]